MKHLGYIQLIVLVLLVWLGWQMIDRIAFREETITPLEVALQSAENNRKELEKVLCHYQKNPADSLKYKAACFLIENMPNKYSINGKEQKIYDIDIVKADSLIKSLEHSFFLKEKSPYLKNYTLIQV